jgi:hypothetical protein
MNQSPSWETKKFLTFYGTQRFITVPKRAHNLWLSLLGKGKSVCKYFYNNVYLDKTVLNIYLIRTSMKTVVPSYMEESSDKIFLTGLSISYLWKVLLPQKIKNDHKSTLSHINAVRIDFTKKEEIKFRECLLPFYSVFCLPNSSLKT